jgi:hypothetical protein
MSIPRSLTRCITNAVSNTNGIPTIYINVLLSSELQNVSQNGAMELSAVNGKPIEQIYPATQHDRQKAKASSVAGKSDNVLTRLAELRYCVILF